MTLPPGGHQRKIRCVALELIGLVLKLSGQAAESPCDTEVDGRAREAEQDFSLPPEIHCSFHSNLSPGVGPSCSRASNGAPAASSQPLPIADCGAPKPVACRSETVAHRASL